MQTCTPSDHVAAPVHRHVGPGGHTISAECPACGRVFWRAREELLLDQDGDGRAGKTVKR